MVIFSSQHTDREAKIRLANLMKQIISQGKTHSHKMERIITHRQNASNCVLAHLHTLLQTVCVCVHQNSIIC